MTFVDDHVYPLNFGQNSTIFDDEFVRRKQDLPATVPNSKGEISSYRRGTLVTDDFYRGGPSSKLQCPIGHCTEREDDEEWTLSLFLFHEEGDEGDCLDGFAETHFVCEDAVEMVVEEGYHPLETFDLIVFQFSADEKVRLFSNFLLDAMGDGVIIDFFFLILILVTFNRWHRTRIQLLFCNGSSQSIQIRTRLFQQMRNSRIFCLIDEVQIRLFIIILQCCKT